MKTVNPVLELANKKSSMAVLTFRSAQELHHQFQHQPQTLFQQQQPKRKSQQQKKINQPPHQQQKQQQMKLMWSYILN